MDDELIERLRQTLGDGRRILYAMHGDFTGGSLCSPIRGYAKPGVILAKDDTPEPGPGVWLENNAFVPLWNTDPKEFFEVRPLFRERITDAEIQAIADKIVRERYKDRAAAETARDDRNTNPDRNLTAFDVGLAWVESLYIHEGD